MDFNLLMAVLFSGITIIAIYDIKKKNEVKLETIKLERDRVALEQKRIESDNKKSG